MRVDDGVEEAPVVGDDEHARRRSRRGSSSSQARPSASRWLVGSSSSRTSRVLEQRRGQQRAGLLAAREAPQRAVAGSRWSIAEAAADLLRARLGRPGAGGLGALERVRVGVEVVRARGARRAPRRPRRAASWSSVVERRVAAPPAAGSRRVRWSGDRAAVGLLAAGEQAQQRRLAGAVGADEAGAVAGVEGQRQPFEEGRAVIALRQVECA